ncbi:hypothetical protein ACFE04_018032 [Oxalis oulophora]
MAKVLGGQCLKMQSCRLRWINYLRDNLKRGNITLQEEELIVKLHSSIGNKWSLIASHLPGRTDNEIKNYWNSHLSRKLHSFRKIITTTSTIPPTLTVASDNNKTKKKTSGNKNKGRKSAKKKKVKTNEPAVVKLQDCPPKDNALMDVSSEPESILVSSPFRDDCFVGMFEDQEIDSLNGLSSYFDDIIMVDPYEPSRSKSSGMEKQDVVLNQVMQQGESPTLFDNYNGNELMMQEGDQNLGIFEFDDSSTSIDYWDMERLVPENNIHDDDHELLTWSNNNNNYNDCSRNNEEVISWLWNDDGVEEEISKVADETKQNAMVAWLLS